ncbi:hypothetical protein QM012_005547 [Aureobasidium pullulans]|uniref:Uncharacterized protein n=1 Tax=Aureobasidium pullulans TaxID=5580 RepID=A0ABR0T5N0_AURPU
MTTSIVFSIHDVINVRLNINILAIAFWCAVAALAVSTPARAERSRRRHQINALLSQAEDLVRRQGEEDAGEEGAARRRRGARVGRN